ncbi:HAD family hydrolase [Klenkia sp. LSe6-5]|uniref:HAD family hydrolase n=1 Tax=Klenkia sesuvii TaxID=3103137 RepID=A0ABU8DSL0_9ACTN
MSGVLVATDLDRTLIYSLAAAGAPRPGERPWVVVERLEGRAVSHVTELAAARYAALARRHCVVPVTTRTPAQLARVQLPGPPARWAVAANGGVVLVDGGPDPSWTARVREALGGVAGLEEAAAELARACTDAPDARRHEVPGLFCYAVVDRPALPEHRLAQLRAWASGAGWGVSLQGRKLYVVPSLLTKSAAVAEVAGRAGAEVVLAAGDSLLDTDLLERATLAVRPGHGELADAGWTRPHVTALTTRGIAAGEEILAWFADRAAAGVAGAPGTGVAPGAG